MSVPARPARIRDPLQLLRELPPRQQLELICAGGYSRDQLNRWAARHPGHAPLVNGELPWIALGLADLD
jgi:hypothetical protein